LKRIGMGLLMKLVFAQSLSSSLANALQASNNGSATPWGGLDVLFIGVGFGFQLFMDFAGYSNMSIGAARIFGFCLEENFDSPYLSSTPSMFWTKWHMSLSFWIRDYVFLPIAQLRREAWWRYFALFLSMVIFGLWHGARLTFLLWGAYHGILLVAHRLSQRVWRKAPRSGSDRFADSISCGLTFLAISLGWVLFRAEDLREAATMLESILSPQSYTYTLLPHDYYYSVLALTVGYFGYHGLVKRWLSDISLSSMPRYVQWSAYSCAAVTVAFVALLLLTRRTDVNPFLYAMF